MWPHAAAQHPAEPMPSALGMAFEGCQDQANEPWQLLPTAQVVAKSQKS